MCTAIAPYELPRAAGAWAHEDLQGARAGWMSEGVRVQHQQPVTQSVCVTSEDRQANDLWRSEIQSTSYLVVDNVRSTMTRGQLALVGLDSFAMLECYAPASLVIDEWGVDPSKLEPAPPLSSVSGKPLNIVGILAL